MKLNGRLSRIANISEPERDQMFLLMDTYYEHMDRCVFDNETDEGHGVNRCNQGRRIRNKGIRDAGSVGVYR